MNTHEDSRTGTEIIIGPSEERLLSWELRNHEGRILLSAEGFTDLDEVAGSATAFCDQRHPPVTIKFGEAALNRAAVAP